jgi:hypothetical protein
MQDDDTAAPTSASPTTPTGSLLGVRERGHERRSRDNDTESDTGVLVNSNGEEVENGDDSNLMGSTPEGEPSYTRLDSNQIQKEGVYCSL